MSNGGCTRRLTALVVIPGSAASSIRRKVFETILPMSLNATTSSPAFR
jgi:hypothetical protein